MEHPDCPRVLYVTANADEAEGAERYLPEHTEAGIRVMTARTVDDALGLLDDGFDCVVSDHELPDISGIVFLQAVRAEYPDMPFLLFTREGDEELASRAISACVTDYLIKEEYGEQWEDLASLIESAVEYRRARGSRVTSPQPVFEAMVDAVAVVRDGEVVYANDAMAECLGTSGDGIVGNSVAGFFKDSSGVERLVSSVEEGGDRVERITEQLHGGSSSAPVEVNAVRVDWERQPAALVVLSDVSRRAAVERRRMERVKELSLIKDVAEILGTNDGRVEDVLTEVVGLVPEAVQYPDTAEARLVYGSFEVTTDGYESREDSLEAVTETADGKRLSLEVVYLDGMPDEYHGPFLLEEKHLVVTVVRLLRNYLERRTYHDELRRGEERMSLVLEVSGGGIWEWNPRTNEGFWDDNLEHLLGFEPEEFGGGLDDFMEYVHPDDTEEVHSEIERCLETGDDLNTEFRIVRDDEVRWLAARGTPIFEGGEAVRFVGGCLDVTDRKEYEHELEQARDELKGVIDSMNETVWVIGDDDEFLEVNQAAVDMLGYTRDELLSMYPYGIDAGLEDAEISELIENLPDEGTQIFETVHETKDGEEIPVEISSSVVTYRGEKAILSIARDITERLENEREMRLKTKAMDDAPIGITISDSDEEDNPLVYANRGFGEITGYARDEVIGRNCRFLQGDETDDEAVAEMRAAIDDEEETCVELWNYRKDGTRFWNRVTIAPVRDESGEVTNYVGFQEDVTERKEREHHMRVTDRVLRHNLRNDLNIVRGYAETIHDAVEDDDLRGFAEGIVEKSDEILGRADKERDIIEMLTRSPVRVKKDISEVARRAVESSRNRYPDVRFGVDTPDTAHVSVCDGFEKVVGELIENAVVHNDSDSPEVRVVVERDDGKVRLRVSDNGPGIPEMDAQVLAEFDETPLYHGSGLGLWLTYWVVERSGGKVSFGANGERGSVVTVTLHAAEETEVEESMEEKV